LLGKLSTLEKNFIGLLKISFLLYLFRYLLLLLIDRVLPYFGQDRATRANMLSILTSTTIISKILRDGSDLLKDSWNHRLKAESKLL